VTEALASPYPPRKRLDNIKLIDALKSASNVAEFQRALDAIAENFHPSILSEFDWAEEIAKVTGTPSPGPLNDYITLATIWLNIEVRANQLGLDQESLDSMEAALLNTSGGESIIAAIRELHMPAIDQYVSAKATEVGLEIEAKISEIRNAGRVLKTLNVHLENFHRMLLDLPLTRLDAMVLYRGLNNNLVKVPEPDRDCDAGDWTIQWLNILADYASYAGMAPISALLTDCASRIAWHEVFLREELADGWEAGAGPCGRCAMYFSSMALQTIDTKGEFGGKLYPDSIHIPARVNYTTCPFCGYESPIELPAMFYAPHRHQVVYCLPAMGAMSKDQSIEFFSSAIEDIRTRYAERLTSEERAAFDSASELVTLSWSQFLNAIHMGDTASEHHAVNILHREDGSGILFDAMKNVTRELTPGELAEMLDNADPILVLRPVRDEGDPEA